MSDPNRDLKLSDLLRAAGEARRYNGHGRVDFIRYDPICLRCDDLASGRLIDTMLPIFHMERDWHQRGRPSLFRFKPPGGIIIDTWDEETERLRQRVKALEEEARRLREKLYGPGGRGATL